MYESGPVNMHGGGGGGDTQPDDIQDDGEHGCGGGEDAMENSHIHYQENGVVNGEDVPHSEMYAHGSNLAAVTGNGTADQLTLSFQGEVYVFDDVSPDKVRTLGDLSLLKKFLLQISYVGFLN